MNVQTETFVGYADETMHNIGRFRAVALVTLKRDLVESATLELGGLLAESQVSELKWHKVAGAKYRFAALKTIRFALRWAFLSRMRIDVLVWDCHDGRHAVNSRDDVANLQRMYFHIFKNVLNNRWPAGCDWILYPDENTSMDWAAVKDYVGYTGEKYKIDPTLPGLTITLNRAFSIREVTPCQSHREPLIQMADLFAGMAAFSHEKYDRYELWTAGCSAQKSFLPAAEGFVATSSERERFTLLRDFDDLCKANTAGISLKSRRGLSTFKPKNPVNFWLYIPQRDEDKAPTTRGDEPEG